MIHFQKNSSRIAFLKAHWYYALASAAGGLLLAISFPPVGLGLASWVAFITLFWAIDGTGRLSAAAFFGALFGAAFFFVDVSWIYATLRIHGHFTPMPAMALLVSMVLILALFPAVSTLLAYLLSRKGLRAALTLPFIWVAFEYLRTVGIPDFPWDLVGYSQIERVRLIQIVDITGIYGVSFLIVAVNGLLWELVTGQAPSRKLLARVAPELVAALLVAALLYGHVRLKDFPETPQKEGGFPIGVEQANIPQEIKWNDTARDHTFATYEEVGKQAVRSGARLLIWPETSVPVVFGSSDADWKRAGEISLRLTVPMLIGAPSLRLVQGATSYYNSAFLVDGPSLRFRYDKIHLVPFGEYMPWTWLLPLGPGIAAREADFTPGETMTVMSVDECPPFSVLICYEAIFPELSRLALKNGAKLLINITNDGWFGATAAPYQHLAMARVRSIENRVWLVRCANTGISAAFDPAGRTVKSIPLDQRGFFVVRVPKSGAAGSFYSGYGDLFAWGCIALTLAFVFVAALDPATRRREKK